MSESNFTAKKINFAKLEKVTKLGNLYQHDTLSQLAENENLIWIYVCGKELKTEWNKRSSFSYDGYDKKNNLLSFTLARFLTSKGLRKDSEGMNALSDDEIKAIERGSTNVKYQSVSSFEGRLYETFWEINLYNKTGDANGHSLTQRFEYWKTSFIILKENLIFGVGTGDLQLAFDATYIRTKTKLNPEYRLRSHNQYLSIAVGFGLLGLIWFVFTLIYPLIKEKKASDYLYITFFIITIISFLTEDTLETQAGVTFYAFLNSLFLFAKKN